MFEFAFLLGHFCSLPSVEAWDDLVLQNDDPRVDELATFDVYGVYDVGNLRDPLLLRALLSLLSV